MIDLIKFSTGAAAGGAGNATVTGYSQPISGRVLAVSVMYVDEPPVTTDLLVYDENDHEVGAKRHPIADPIVQLFNTNTDRKLYPRRAISTFDGADILYADAFPVYDHFVAHGRLSAVMVGADPGDSVELTVWLER
jgi:hypothetical protein